MGGLCRLHLAHDKSNEPIDRRIRHNSSVAGWFPRKMNPTTAPGHVSSALMMGFGFAGAVSRMNVSLHRVFNLTLYFFLLVIVSLMCGSAPANGELSIRCVWATLAMVSGWIVLGHVSARWMARQVLRGEVEFNDAAKFLRSQLDIFRWFALPITIMCLYGFSLSAYMRIQPVLESSMVLQAIVLLMPGMSLLVSTWSAEYYFAAAIGTQSSSLTSYVRAMGRMMRSGPAWLIVPTLAVMGMGDLVGWINLHFETTENGYGETLAKWLPLAVVVGVAMVACLFPWVVRFLAKTEPIESEVAGETNAWIRGCGMSTHWLLGMQIARWDTGGRMLNAMVAGIVRPGRLLLMSDRLLDELPRGHRLMVVMHELAHVKRWHVPLRMLAIIPAWIVSNYAGTLLIEYEWFDETIGASIGAILGLATTVVSLGMVSHFCELDADATACRLAVRACKSSWQLNLHSPTLGEIHYSNLSGDRPELTEAMAAEMLADALTYVTADHPASRKVSWMHPSLATRVNRLRRISHPLPDQAVEGHTWAL